MTFGILTLATPNDYKKAIGLALSAKITNPGVPLAVACAPKLRAILEPFFDYVIDEDSTLRGFEHKVHLDKYSPFTDTFFFDSDVLLFRNIREVAERWGNQTYTAAGEYMSDGFSCFGMDRSKVLSKIGKSKLAVIDGAGHAYFRKPGCIEVFELARLITEKHSEYVGNIGYADEDVIDIAMTLLDLSPSSDDFFARYLSAVPGTMVMDARVGICYFQARHSGKRMDPYMMHFAANEAPFIYARQLRCLFEAYGVETKGLYRDALHDSYLLHVLWPLKQHIKKLIGKFK